MLYAEGAKEGADEIERYWKARDIENVTVKVHALKSTSRVVGAMRLGDFAEQLEKAGNDGDTDTLEKNMTELIANYRALGEALSPLVQSEEASDLPEMPREQLEDVAEYREILDEGRHVVLCHYPIFAFHDHYFGWFHLYGHVHGSYEWNIAENTKRLLRNLYVRADVCRMANVGAMLPYMAYTPRSLDELLAAPTAAL